MSAFEKRLYVLDSKAQHMNLIPKSLSLCKLDQLGIEVRLAKFHLVSASLSCYSSKVRLKCSYGIQHYGIHNCIE